MIRRLESDDIDVIAKIWLDTNIQAHSFISKEYWETNLDLVRKNLLEAEIYIYENGKNIIQGFIGITGNYIAGIFVIQEMQSKGIGKKLIDFVKNIRNKLSLNVYIKNERAVSFYLREGFTIKKEVCDINTGEKEYHMIWHKANL